MTTPGWRISLVAALWLLPADFLLLACRAANPPPAMEFICPTNGANFVDPGGSVQVRVVGDNLSLYTGVYRLNGAFPVKGGISDVLVADHTYNVTLYKAIDPNQDYEVYFEIFDRAGQKSSGRIWFDTFAPTNRVIEVEDYNFAGGFLDNPMFWPLGETNTMAYNGRAGVMGVDFGVVNPSAWKTNAYRPANPIGMRISGDLLHLTYTDFQWGIPRIPDLDLAVLRQGEWFNYTRHFPTGVCQVYLRQFVKADHVRARLEEVFGDRESMDQTARPAGAFIGSHTGGIYRNVPLTDATGKNLLPMRMGGLATWRLVHESDDATGDSWFENYLVLVPVADGVKLRPALTQATPLPEAALDGIYPVVRAVLTDRDTGLNRNSIRLDINGQPVPASIGMDQGDAILTFAPVLANSSANFSASISFRDGEGQSQTNQWNFSVRNVDLSLQLLAADQVDGAYNSVSPLKIDMATQTLEAPLANQAQFYRLQLAATVPCAIKLYSVRVEGQSLLLRYGF